LTGKLEVGSNRGEKRKLSLLNDEKSEKRLVNQLRLLMVSGKESLGNLRVISLNRSLKGKFVNSKIEDVFKVFKKIFAVKFESKFPNFSLSHKLVLKFGIKLLDIFENCNVLFIDVKT
jgi:hypothetical protein